jgi:hypothetical protein
MSPVQPLEQFPLIATDSVEEAECALSGSLAPCHIRSDPKRFNVRLNGINLGRISLTYNHYGADSKVLTEFAGDPVFFVAGHGNRSTFRLKDRTVESRSKYPVLISGATRMDIDRPKDSGILVLRASLPDLEHHLATLADDRLQDRLVFDGEVDLSQGAGRSLMRLMWFLAGELDADPSLAENTVFRGGTKRCF